MRPAFFTTKRRARRANTATRLSKGRRRTPAAAGGPVGPTAEYVRRRGRRNAGSNGRASGSGVLPRPHSSMVLRRIVLTVLICASFGLITATYRGGVVIHSAQLQALQVVAPIERGLTRAWDPIANTWNWFGDLFHATSENPKLIDENEQLHTQLSGLKTVEQENQRLQALVNFEGSTKFPRDLTPTHGRVIGTLPGTSDRTLVIDLGTTRGVHVNDPVLATGGLIGIVTAVREHIAVVGLITSSDQSVGARVDSEKGGSGVLQAISTEGVPALRLTSVSQKSDVAVGDQVVTSGFRDFQSNLHSKYPPNLVIGVVTDAGNSPGELNKTIQVTPYADFENIVDVTVLTGGNQEAIDSEVASVVDAAAPKTSTGVGARG